MKHAALAALLLLLDHFSHGGVVKGATVTNAEFTNGSVKITVTNVSQLDITGFVIGVTCKHPNGETSWGSKTEDSGPHLPLFHPGETKELETSCPTIPESVGVDAEVVVAIYSDHTAEVKDERSYNDLIDHRQGVADGLEMIAGAVKEALLATDSGLTSAPPNVHAQQILQILLKKARAGSINAGDKMFLQSLLQGEIDTMKTAPAGREREFVQGEANRLQKQATQAQKYADVRRLP
jgi:hypothetical protein